MKKRVCLTIVFCISIIAWLIMTYSQRRVTWLCMDEEGIYILLKADNRNEIIRPWQEKENTPYYFFLPAFANDGELFADASIEGGSINNLSIKRRSSLKWKEGKEYRIAVGTILTNYEAGIGDAPNNMPIWYMALYEDDEFYACLIKNYHDILPYMEKVLSQGIDDYVNWISASMRMDTVLMQAYLMPDETYSYTQYDSYIRYLKFFLANRLNYLNSIWGIEDVNFKLPQFTQEYHEVVFKNKMGDIIEKTKILDGRSINRFPIVMGVKEGYYCWLMNGGNKAYDAKIPVLEDLTLYLCK